MATSGEKRWPPVGNFVAASGEKPMAIDRAAEAGAEPHLLLLGLLVPKEAHNRKHAGSDRC